MQLEQTENAKGSSNATSITMLALAAVVALAGLMIANFQANWIAGSLGISTAAASQIVAAIKAGQKAATAVGAVAGFGIGSALTATLTWVVFNYATEIAVA